MSFRSAPVQAVAASLLAAVPAFAQVPPNPTMTPPVPLNNLFFDFFLADNGGQPANGFGDPLKPLQQYLLWTVTDGTTDLVGGNVPGIDDLPDGRFVDLGGSTNDPGRMQTRESFPFTSALTYELFFEYRSTDGLPATAVAEVAGKTFQVTTSSTDFQQFRTTFTVTAPVTTPLTTALAFQDTGPADNGGVGIDAVQLNVVPEPTGLAVVGLAGTWLLRRRRAGDSLRV